MRFAAVVCASAVAAEQIKLPNISWDKNAIEKGLNTAKDYFEVQKKLDMSAGKQIVRDIGKTLAYWTTSNGVNWAKEVKPYANLYSRWLRAMTMDDKCNVEAASKCVWNHWGVENAMNGKGWKLGSNTAMGACLKKANCQYQFQKMTPTQQKAAKAKFMADLKKAGQNVDKLEGDVEKVLEAKIKQGMANYAKYEEKSYKVWGKYAAQFAKDLKCNAPCVDKCVAGAKGKKANEKTAQVFAQCIAKCPGCAKNVVNIDWKPTKGTKLAAIEEHYEALENLDDEDFQDIAETLEYIY